MSYLGITRDQIKTKCSKEAFEEGEQIYQNNRVIYARARNDGIEAAVDVISRYEVTRIVEYKGNLESICMCDYNKVGYCKHAVAVLLYLQDNPDKISDDKHEKYDKIRAVLDRMGADHAKKFLTSELEKSKELRERFARATSKKDHSVAENMHKGTDRQKTKDILKGTTAVQRQEFLAVEIEKNKDLRDRFESLVDKHYKKEDYHAMTEQLYKKAAKTPGGKIKDGTMIDFDPIKNIGYKFAVNGNYEEAISVFKGLTEVIAKNMNKVNDPDKYYECYLDESLEFMVEWMDKTKTPTVKRQHLSYLIERLAHSDTVHIAHKYSNELDPELDLDHAHIRRINRMYMKRTDRVFLAMLLKPYIPDTIPARDKNEKEYHIVSMLAKMMVRTLSFTRDKSRDDFIAKHYKDIDSVCLWYIDSLGYPNYGKALQVAEEGVRLFPDNEEIMLKLHDMYRRSNPKYVESLHRIFVHKKTWEHYDELKKLSKRWGAEFESLVLEFGRRGDYDMQVKLFLKEGMHEDAARLVARHGSLDMLEQYRKELASFSHKKYYEAYIKRIDELAKKAHDKATYKSVKKHLKNAKGIQYHRKEVEEFKEFVGMLRARHAKQAEFLDELESF